MGHCKDCKFRDKEESMSGKHLCVCPKFTSDRHGDSQYGADDSMIYSYDEGGGFYVGEYFGCIHWQPTPRDESSSA